MNSRIDSGASEPGRRSAHGHAAEVRAAALWAFIGAACLVYFGWLQLSPTPFSPGKWTWHLGDHLTIYTMRFGGLALLAVVGLLLLGKTLGLALDGLVSMAIGAGLAVGGILMLKGGMPTQSVLYVIFGIVFFQAGRSSLSEYNRLAIQPGHGATAGGLPLFGDDNADEDPRGPDQ